MPAFVFSPLEISRAAGLADETKRVIAAFEQCLASSDMGGLSALRAAIEVRRERRAAPSRRRRLKPPRPLTALPICFFFPHAQRRIDELDVFYHENLVDERSLLFGCVARCGT